MDNNIVGLSFLSILLVCVLIIYVWNKAEDNTFRLIDALLGPDGKLSIYKLGQAVALVVSTWGFVILTQQGKLTEWYFSAYMGIWVTAGVVKSVTSGGTNAGTH